MNLCVNTDFVSGTGDPRPYLEYIARAGFTHVHWCHEWCTDYIYTDRDVQAIASLLKSLGLSLLDLHASAGRNSRWVSSDESCRSAGIALVANRIAMTAGLGSDAIVLHIPYSDGPDSQAWFDLVCRSLDELEPVCTRAGVRIAIENLLKSESWPQINELIARYSPGFLGLCYDSGHGNYCPGSLDNLEQLKNRLLALHLHDNDGSGDQHKIPFNGSVDWQRLAGIIAVSSYSKCVSMEVSKRCYQDLDELRFLAAAYEAGKKLDAMVAGGRRAAGRSPEGCA